MVITTVSVSAGLFVAHGKLDVILQYTWSPLTGMILRVSSSVPEGEPLTNHEYDGAVPPLTAAVEKITSVPSQTDNPGETVIVPLTGRLVAIVIVRGAEFAGLLETQSRLDVTWQ